MKKPFNTPKKLQMLIDSYFQTLEPDFVYDKDGNMLIDKNGLPIMTERKPATIASMAYAVGLSTKAELIALEEDEKYSETVRRALLRVEAHIERMLFDKTSSSGAKYLLQESFGRETIEIDDQSDGGVVILSEVSAGAERQ